MYSKLKIVCAIGTVFVLSLHYSDLHRQVFPTEEVPGSILARRGLRVVLSGLQGKPDYTPIPLDTEEKHVRALYHWPFK